LEDGRLTPPYADTELAAAEALTAWLGAEPEGNEGLVFVLGKDTALLDNSLAKAGLPRLGWSAPSPHRALLQILPLAFALAWDPPDPNRAPRFPAPADQSLAAVRRHSACERRCRIPGHSGEDWIAAWAKIEKALAEEADADPKVHAKHLDSGRAFVNPSDTITKGSVGRRKESGPSVGVGRPSGLGGRRSAAPLLAQIAAN